MKAIKIISKSEKGKQAIMSTILQDKKATLVQKAMLKSMGGEMPRIVNEEPLTLKISIPKKVIPFINKNDFIQQAKFRMQEQDAKFEQDYIIEEEE